MTLIEVRNWVQPIRYLSFAAANHETQITITRSARNGKLCHLTSLGVGTLQKRGYRKGSSTIEGASDCPRLYRIGSVLSNVQSFLHCVCAFLICPVIVRFVDTNSTYL